MLRIMLLTSHLKRSRLDISITSENHKRIKKKMFILTRSFLGNNQRNTHLKKNQRTLKSFIHNPILSISW